MTNLTAIRRSRKTILELFGEMALSDIDYLDSEDLGNGNKKNRRDIEEDDDGDEDEDDMNEDKECRDDSEGETLGSEDWSHDESDNDSQERRDLGDFIAEDDWGREESDDDFIESSEEDDSYGSTEWDDAESWSVGDNSEYSEAYEGLEGSTDEEGDN